MHKLYTKIHATHNYHMCCHLFCLFLYLSRPPERNCQLGSVQLIIVIVMQHDILKVLQNIFEESSISLVFCPPGKQKLEKCIKQGSLKESSKTLRSPDFLQVLFHLQELASNTRPFIKAAHYPTYARNL